MAWGLLCEVFKVFRANRLFTIHRSTARISQTTFALISLFVITMVFHRKNMRFWCLAAVWCLFWRVLETLVELFELRIFVVKIIIFSFVLKSANVLSFLICGVIVWAESGVMYFTGGLFGGVHVFESSRWVFYLKKLV